MCHVLLMAHIMCPGLMLALKCGRNNREMPVIRRYICLPVNSPVILQREREKERERERKREREREREGGNKKGGNKNRPRLGAVEQLILLACQRKCSLGQSDLEISINRVDNASVFRRPSKIRHGQAR